MTLIQVMTFRLVDGADEAAFVEADKRVQTDFAYQQPGLVRRTTARGDGKRPGEWITIGLWHSADHADAAGGRWGDDPSAHALMAFVDPDSVEVRRYVDLD